MKKFSVSLLFLILTKFLIGQDSLLTYTKILKVDSLSKNEIFDKSLIWCSKTFVDSKSAIKVKERESGIIGGKAFYQSFYKVPKKKDSITGLLFTNYYFDWLIEIKDQVLTELILIRVNLSE